MSILGHTETLWEHYDKTSTLQQWSLSANALLESSSFLAQQGLLEDHEPVHESVAVL